MNLNVYRIGGITVSLFRHHPDIASLPAISPRRWLWFHRLPWMSQMGGVGLLAMGPWAVEFWGARMPRGCPS